MTIDISSINARRNLAATWQAEEKGPGYRTPRIHRFPGGINRNLFRMLALSKQLSSLKDSRSPDKVSTDELESVVGLYATIGKFTGIIQEEDNELFLKVRYGSTSSNNLDYSPEKGWILIQKGTKLRVHFPRRDKILLYI